MINKFDIDSEIMNDHCMELSRWIFDMSAISRYGEEFLAWNGTLILIYVISRYQTIILTKYEKNLITIHMSFIKIFVFRNFKYC